MCRAMYEGHFQLERRPFAATPDASCCYLSPALGPQFENVVRCVEQGRGIAILTGPAGIGKTLLAQVLLTELESHFTGVYLGTGQFPTRRAFLQAILYELGQPYGGMTDQELRLELSTALRHLITQKDGLLLILDEAHLLSDRLLEEVRMLVDLAQQGVPLVRVVLCGNPEFEERLTAPALSAFNQRVACHESIDTLLRAESISYLQYRVQWAGGVADRLFDAGALQLIAEASDGVPRCRNHLADHTLTQAFLAGANIASEALVRESLTALQHLPLRWNASALLSRSWSSKTEVEPSFAEHPESTTESRAAETGEEESQASESSDSSCFEFGAGDDSRFAGNTDQSGSATSDTTDEQSTTTAIRDSSVESGASDPSSFEIDCEDSACFETNFETNAVEFSTFGTDARADLLAADSANEQSDESEQEVTAQAGVANSEALPINEALSVNQDRPLFIRVALNSRVANNGPEDQPANPDFSRRAVEQSSEEIDVNQPAFTWLNHPVASPDPVEKPVAEFGQDEEAVSEFQSVPKFRIRANPESDSSDSTTTSHRTRTSHGSSNQFEAVRKRGFTPKLSASNAGTAPATGVSSPDAELAEEIVVDRYAALDASCRVATPSKLVKLQTLPSAGLSSSTSSRSIKALSDLENATSQSANATTDRLVSASVLAAATESPTQSSTASHPTIASSIGEPRSNTVLTTEEDFIGHPMEQIDSICALIETADEYSSGGIGVELVTDWGVERIDVDLPSETIPQETSNSVQSLYTNSNQSDWLGSTVVEIGREFSQHFADQHVLPPSLADDVSFAPHSNLRSETPQAVERVERVERMTQYDIVEPPETPEMEDANVDFRLDAPAEAHQSRSEAGIPANPATRSTTHSRFHNLFSTLRRRQVSPGSEARD
jgi:type II secretory pathway predicted ATPase ExeA